MKIAVCLSVVILLVLLILWACLELSAVSDPGDVEIYEDGEGNVVIHRLEK